MKYNQKGSVFVYTLILVMLALSMAMIIRSNIGVLENNYQITENKNDFLSHTEKFARYLIDKNKYYNSNGGGIGDNISCPINVIMSGSTQRTTNITTSLAESSGEIICRGTYNSQNIDILFSGDKTTLDRATWGSNGTLNLSGEYSKNSASSFSDSDATFISFDSSYYNLSGGADGIDDNVNSDDYTSESSTGSNYPGNIIDDDILAKIEKNGVLKNGVWQNIFWNNTKIEEYINENTNNISTKTSILGTSTGKLFLDVEQNIQLNVTQFDKTLFQDSGELVINSSQIFDISSGSGYLQNDGTLSSNLSGSEFLFDFNTIDYGLFANNLHTQYAKYNLNFIDNDGKSIIFLPIKDDDPIRISVLAYDMMLDNTGRYMYTIKEFFDRKN